MTTTVKAKCPGCGDEEGEQAKALIECKPRAWMDMRTLWKCGVCKARWQVGSWISEPKPIRLHQSDIEAIASRVVELLKS